MNFKFFSWIMLASLSLMLTACPCNDCCKKEEVKANEECCNPAEKQRATVLVRPALCGTGAWENLWLTSPKDSSEFAGVALWLRPFEIAKSIVESGYTPKEGDLLEIIYSSVTKDDGRYNNIASCEAYPGEHQNVCISDLRVIRHHHDGHGDGDGNGHIVYNHHANATFKRVDCSAGAWGNLWLEIEMRADSTGHDGSSHAAKTMLLYPFGNEATVKRMPQEGEKVEIQYNVINFVRPDDAVSACKIEGDYLPIVVGTIKW